MFSFIKAQALGNDFIMTDHPLLPRDKLIELSYRKHGIGCDQWIFVSSYDDETPTLRFFNADGSESEACGNGTRCVAHHLMKHQHKNDIILKTNNREIHAYKNGNRITVNMGAPQFEWDKIPMNINHDTLKLPLQWNGLQFPIAVNVGNPHLIFFTPEPLINYDLMEVGPLFENHALFPNRVNVSLAHIISDHEIDIKVWERGAGFTGGCGTGACAAAIAAITLKQTRNNTITIHQLGGNLEITLTDGSLWMSGESQLVFHGHVIV
jgi:diaminopimelate epimerase